MGGDRLWGVVDGLAAMPDNAANRKLWAAAARAIAERLDSATVVERLSALQGAAGTVLITEATAALLNRTDCQNHE